MTLGAINGRSIETILEGIPDANLRAAYRNALEYLSLGHPGLLENPDQLALFLNARVSEGQGIDYQSLSEAVSHGRLHADEYVAAAYLLASSTQRYSVANGLFCINPLWAEHLVLWREQEDVLGSLRRSNTENHVEMLTALRDANDIGDGVLEYLQYFHALSPEVRAAWSALETYRDHGTQTDFLDLRTQLEYAESFYQRHVMTSGAFEVEEIKPENRGVVIIPQFLQWQETDEPVCAPNDPSCED